MPKFSKKRAYDEEDDSGAEIAPKTAKKSKGPSSSGGSGKDADGNSFWELSAKRRVTVSEFKGSTFVNIREYYDAEGEMRPGKKGIMLTVEQYHALLKAVPAINAALLQQGVATEEVDLDGEDKLSSVVKTKKKAPKSKANIEATSDEESEG